MVMQSGLRPEWLDFQVYRRVAVQMESVERVGESMRMAPQLIARWVNQITLFLLNVAQKNDTMTPEQEKRLALQLCAERIDHLVALALRAFERSQGKQTTWRQRSGGDKMIVTVDSPGDPRYLALAVKFMEKMRDLPPPRLSSAFVDDEQLDDDEDESEDFPAFAQAALQLSAEEIVELRRQYEQHGFGDQEWAKPQVKSNPFGECSAYEAEEEEDDEDDDEESTITRDEIIASVEAMRARDAAEKAAQRPVQADAQGGNGKTLPDKKKAARKAFFDGA